MSDLRLCLALAALLFPGAALAADMPDIGFAPPPEVQDFGSNWYLRGDVGYRAESPGSGAVQKSKSGSSRK